MWLLWIFSLAASFLLPATGEVVQSFSQCHQFFLNGTPPNVVPEKPARICQKYNNKYHFATMYDKSRRIPIFSAYKYESGSGRRPTVWMIEPQVRGVPILKLNIHQMEATLKEQSVVKK
uniref:Uncharacterized protein n=1 Tax=Naja naja TaxID=35670 RepID=A0A8C7DWW4_NAJNA